VPVTSDRYDPTLAHYGWGLGGGAELAVNRFIALRLGFDALWIKPSPVSPEGILYRGWEGLRISLTSGYAFPLSAMTVEVAAGGALTAAEYRGTSLVFAYPSLMVQADLVLPLLANGAVRLSLPLELMLRGSYVDFSPGLSASYVWSIPQGARE
jgi:hypothetical protein